MAFTQIIMQLVSIPQMHLTFNPRINEKREDYTVQSRKNSRLFPPPHISIDGNLHGKDTKNTSSHTQAIKHCTHSWRCTRYGRGSR